MTVFMASDQASGITGTTVNLTMGSLDDLLLRSPLALTVSRADSIRRSSSGFPGFVSKLWLANDTQGLYRGVYEWDGPDLAEAYARALWGVLALVSTPGSIHDQVLPGLRRDEVLAQPDLLTTDDGNQWWRPVQPLAAVV